MDGLSLFQARTCAGRLHPARVFFARRFAPFQRGWARDGLCLALLAAVYLGAAAAVGPSGEFPLNDDWSFVGSVRRLVETHDWRPLGWAGMSQVTHAALGAVVCSFARCTFEHLRAATLLAGTALSLSCYVLYRRAGGSCLRAGVAAIAATLNPVLFPLAFTFMTDVPFALLTVLGTAACVDVLRTGRWRSVALAAAIITAASLSRQIGVALAAALLPLYLLVARERAGIRILKASLPLATCAAALLGYEAWMRRTGRLPALYDSQYGELAAAFRDPMRLLGQGIVESLLCGLYLGLVCLPVLLLGPARAGPLRGPSVRWATVVSAAALLMMVRDGAVMPQLGNVLVKSGIGPLTLRDTYILGLPNVPELPAPFWFAVTALGVAGLWLLVARSLSTFSEALAEFRTGPLDPKTATRLFGIGAAGLILVPLLPGGVFDRYVIGVVPVLSLAIVTTGSGGARTGAVRRALACACAAILAAASVAATHDYMAWNRARWRAIADIENSREADAASLDGGFEYNGLRSYDPSYAAEPRKSWWWVDDDRIQIGFGSSPGMAVMRRYDYPTWAPPGTRSVVVLRRAPAGAGPDPGPGSD